MKHQPDYSWADPEWIIPLVGYIIYFPHKNWLFYVLLAVFVSIIFLAYRRRLKRKPHP